jgi:hypothetical protein
MPENADNVRFGYNADENAGLPGGTTRKYIVDIVGGLPVILMELNDRTVERAYIYANGRIDNLFSKLN